MHRFLNFKITFFFLLSASLAFANSKFDSTRIQSVLQDLIVAMEQGRPSRILEKQDFYPFEYMVKNSKVKSVSHLKDTNEYLAKIQFDVIGERKGESPQSVKTHFFPKPQNRIETVRIKPGQHSWVFTRQLTTPYRKNP